MSVSIISGKTYVNGELIPAPPKGQTSSHTTRSGLNLRITTDADGTTTTTGSGVHAVACAKSSAADPMSRGSFYQVGSCMAIGENAQAFHSFH